MEAGEILPCYLRLGNMLEKADGLCRLRNYSYWKDGLKLRILKFYKQIIFYIYIYILNFKHSGIYAIINVKVQKNQKLIKITNIHLIK